MKNLILLISIALLCLQSCKQSTNSDSETLNQSVYVDTTAVIVDTMATEPEKTSTTSYESKHSENNEKLISAFILNHDPS